MIVDGKKIARDILSEVATKISQLAKPLRLVIITCAPNFETQAYLSLKKKQAEKLKVDLIVRDFLSTATTSDLVSEIEAAVSKYDGILVQLPLPKHIDTEAIMAAIPSTHDVDAFQYDSNHTAILPPVIGAIEAISEIYQIDWRDKKAVIFGSGRLVGSPAAIYAKSKEATVNIVTAETLEPRFITFEADIIILGAGQGNLLTPDMVKEGVIVFDAGASEDGGLLVGDANPAVAGKASIFTPVPGGIGPITIAILFRNLLELCGRQ